MAKYVSLWQRQEEAPRDGSEIIALSIQAHAKGRIISICNLHWSDDQEIFMLGDKGAQTSTGMGMRFVWCRPDDLMPAIPDMSDPMVDRWISAAFGGGEVP